jgi:hypothetical protein
MPLEATMTFVVVERSFEEPIEFRLLQDGRMGVLVRRGGFGGILEGWSGFD